MQVWQTNMIGLSNKLESFNGSTVCDLPSRRKWDQRCGLELYVCSSHLREHYINK